MILVIDNFDSFVHNLARHLRLSGAETLVVRDDAIDVAAIREMAPEAIVLSPGPGRPADAGCCVDVVRDLHQSLPMLGVCLGHQAIVEALGGTIEVTDQPMHGHTSVVEHQQTNLFAGVPSPLTVCRYHSLVAQDDSLPDAFRVTARADDGTIMAIEHVTLPVYGVQFHPEAILTEAGQSLIDNFVRIVREWQS
ncbi:MAG: aminodeoxychorismate/anthranilate synthase component II [Planctomycetota bacterium]